MRFFPWLLCSALLVPMGASSANAKGATPPPLLNDTTGHHPATKDTDPLKTANDCKEKDDKPCNPDVVNKPLVAPPSSPQKPASPLTDPAKENAPDERVPFAPSDPAEALPLPMAGDTAPPTGPGERHLGTPAQHNVRPLLNTPNMTKTQAAPRARELPPADPLSAWAWKTVGAKSAMGCALGGGLPALAIVGASGLAATGVVIGNNAATCDGIVLAIVTVIGGLVIGLPSAIALGPLASVGGGFGASMGATKGHYRHAAVWLGAAPGLVLGVVSSGAIVAGLAALSISLSVSGNTPDFNAAERNQYLSIGIIGVGALSALIAGPLTVGGSVLGAQWGEASSVPSDDKDAPTETRPTSELSE